MKKRISNSSKSKKSSFKKSPLINKKQSIADLLLEQEMILNLKKIAPKSTIAEDAFLNELMQMKNPHAIEIDYEKMYFHDLEEHKWFKLSNGLIFKNMTDFLKALSKMDRDTYTTHVNAIKNDFYKWIKDVYADKDLALEIKGKSQKETKQIILKHMSEKLLGGKR